MNSAAAYTDPPGYYWIDNASSSVHYATSQEACDVFFIRLQPEIRRMRYLEGVPTCKLGSYLPGQTSIQLFLSVDFIAGYDAGGNPIHVIDVWEFGSGYPIGCTLYISGYCINPPGLKNVSENTCPSSSEPATSTPHPITFQGGNKLLHETDYRDSGIGYLSFSRTYNSTNALNYSPQGMQWRNTYSRSIIQINNSVYVYRASGKAYAYTLNGSAWSSDVDVNDKLVEIFDGGGARTGWTYTNDATSEVERYDAAGKLLSITNRIGLAQTMGYSCTVVGADCPVVTPPAIASKPGLLVKVTDAVGRSLNFTYDEFSRLNTMTDPSGKMYRYAYDANYNLVSVTYPDGNLRKYWYNETDKTGNTYPRNALTGITDENGVRYASYWYQQLNNGTFRAYKEELAPVLTKGIEKYQLAYTTDANGNPIKTVVTDPLGSQRTYNFTTIQGVVKSTGQSQPGGSGCAAAANNLTYDANGNIATRTDFKGNITSYSYDLTRNLETSRTEASGTPQARTITTQWHPTYRLPTLVTEPLRNTSYTYDDKGNLLTLAIMPMGGTSGPRITHYTYNQYGQVLTIDGPRTDVSDVTSYSYDPQGNLISVSNALNQSTTLSAYDLNGRVGSITNPNGLATYLTYDPRGRLTHRISGSDNTHYTYDGVGNLTGVTLPNGALYTYTYDQAHRLIQIADAQNNRIIYTLDAAGNRVKEETFDNIGNLTQTHSRVFDALNRLWQDIGAVNQTTTYTYDTNGNLTSVIDPLNRISTNMYDALNRLSQVTNPDNGITRYGYDAQDQLTSVTDPRNLITQYQRDGLGNLNQTISPDTGNTNASYDPAGNLASKTDAKGQVATYSYDALNRLTGISYSGGTAAAININYLYDQGINGIGHLTGIVDPTGFTQYSYNQQGHLLSETQQSMNVAGPAPGPVFSTAYSYDPLGRISSITYPSGRTVNYTYDPLGRINQISTTDANSNTTVIASNITYRPFGSVQSYTYGDGQIAQPQLSNRQYDQDGRIASYSLNGQPQIIGYDAASQISFINTLGGPLNPPSIANYSYDPMSRLTSYTQGSANQSYNYDQVGNRTSQLIGSTTTNYGIDPMSNKLASIQSGQGAPQPITQDAIGATTSDTAHQYAYDVRGRLIQATTAQGQINYEVNALGLRVRKQVPYANTDTQYHYDAQGHLIGENPTGTTQFSREYIWLGDIPVAVMQ
jgi:YD repeat-containing protein